jgi:hypothetical protein
MPASKKSVTYRLSETTIKEISDIAKRQKISHADVIAVLIHCYFISGDLDNVDDWFEIARIS